MRLTLEIQVSPCNLSFAEFGQRGKLRELLSLGPYNSVGHGLAPFGPEVATPERRNWETALKSGLAQGGHSGGRCPAGILFVEGSPGQGELAQLTGKL